MRDSTFALEELTAVPAGAGHALGDFSHELYDLREAVVLAIMRA